MYSIRQALLGAATHPLVAAPFKFLLRDRAAVLMLHRFAQPDLGVIGHDRLEIRQTLGALRREGYELLSLEALFNRLAAGEPLSGAMAFTIDDGYVEQAAIAAPAFAEFDVPVTTFVTSGFLDGEIWFWWDQIEYIFNSTMRSSVQVRLADRDVAFAWNTASERELALLEFTEQCKTVADTEKHAAIARLATVAEVELPIAAPPQYAPMSWAQLRASERLGMTFGPHTSTHPILSQTSDAQAELEICGSWERLSAMAARPVPIFCCPNGQPQDFGARELTLMRRSGLVGAVVGTPGYARVTTFSGGPDARFKVPRFVYPDSLRHMRLIASGLEFVKERVRGAPWA